MLGSNQRVNDRARIVALQPSVCRDCALTFSVGARIHQNDAIARAKNNQALLEHTHTIVGDAVEEEHPGAVGMCGANLPATQQNAIRSANVERFTQRSNLCEGSIGLLDEIGRERAADGMQKRRSDEPANHHSNDGRGEKQNDQRCE